MTGPGTILEVEILRLVHGGDGLARTGERVVLVPFSAPGDRLRVRVVSQSKGVLRGEIVQILAPSSQRRAPPCAHFGDCGGCQLQHLDYSAQLEAKVAILRDVLRRVGGIRWEGPIPMRSGPELGYRSRVELQAHAGRVGFFRHASHELCEVRDCPVLRPSLQRELPRLVTTEGPSVLAEGDDGLAQEGELVQTIGEFAYRLDARGFLQANRDLVGALVDAAVGEAQGRNALELYAGAGLFTLPLARRFERVVAVEADSRAVALAERTAGEHGVDNMDLHVADVAHWLAAGVEADFDHVLLDPPRRGAGKGVCEALADLGAASVTYVSCDPATLARDLAVLLDREYGLRSVEALDLFPQTFHVETVARLTRGTEAV